MNCVIYSKSKPHGNSLLLIHDLPRLCASHGESSQDWVLTLIYHWPDFERLYSYPP